MSQGSLRSILTNRSFVVIAALVALIAAVLIAGGNVENGPAPFVVGGIVNGAIFGLLALGLVIVYKGTRVFNFAQAEFGTIAAYIVFICLDSFHMPYLLAILTALVLTVGVGLLMERVFIRPLLTAPRVTLLVGTIAMALLAIGAEILIAQIEPKNLKPLVTTSPGGGLHILNATITGQNIVTILVLVALAVLLAWFFSRTDLGLAVLATSQDSFATRVVGIGVERMSMFIWGSAAFLGAIAGILFVPTIGLLVPGVMTSNVLIPAFAGAVLGGMTSLPGAFVGGTVVGVVQALAAWAGGHYTFGVDAAGVPKILGQIVPGIEQVTVLLVLLLVLLARPQGLLGRES